MGNPAHLVVYAKKIGCPSYNGYFYLAFIANVRNKQQPEPSDVLSLLLHFKLPTT